MVGIFILWYLLFCGLKNYYRDNVYINYIWWLKMFFKSLWKKYVWLFYKFNYNNFNFIVRKNVIILLMWKVFNDELKNFNSWLLWKFKEIVLMFGVK